MPRPRPSESEPRMVRGPTQKSSDALSQPSMNRSRAAWSTPASPVPTSAGAAARRVWITPARLSSRSSMRSSDPRCRR